MFILECLKLISRVKIHVPSVCRDKEIVPKIHCRQLGHSKKGRSNWTLNTPEHMLKWCLSSLLKLINSNMIPFHVLADFSAIDGPHGMRQNMSNRNSISVLPDIVDICFLVLLPLYLGVSKKVNAENCKGINFIKEFFSMLSRLWSFSFDLTVKNGVKKLFFFF